ENEHILQLIAAARPDILFVALGAPQQDVWIRANRDRLDVPVCMGVGCVLDLLAGVVSRAPNWMQQSGLEWLYRLGQGAGRGPGPVLRGREAVARFVGASWRTPG